ncbi:MAG: Uncharacterized protein Athens071425_112 [Parcubacteria group bacterium Athens0714_25]|nr:MAG: Uncharacterized protein Athens071425_112 [Parcubacteria group bacterium Athens0714_25]
MLNKIAKHTNKILIFVINILLVIVGSFIIKNRDKHISIEVDTEKDLSPVSADILADQDKIATDRENKLRDLNSTPKEIQQKEVTTTTTTATSTPEPSKSSSNKTTKSS